MTKLSILTRYLSLFSVLVFLSVSILPALNARAEDGYHIITSLPGTDINQGAPASGISLASYINNIYIFSLGIVGLFAVAAMVYWSFVYTTSAGNPSKMSDAIGGIKDAALGLILLLLATVVLKIINPKLVELSSLDNVENIPEQSVEYNGPVWRPKNTNGFGVQDCSGYGMVSASGCVPPGPYNPPDNNLCCKMPEGGPTG